MENLRAFNAFNTIKPEQKAAKREGRDYLDSFINQAISKEHFLSFPRGGDTPMQLIQLLSALDQQGSKKIQSKGTSTMAPDLSGIKGDASSMKRNGHIGRVSSSALAHAAAKVNSDTEKFLPGWPLMSPSKLPLKKCEKCSQEFCSTVNYRRHIRMHRRSLHIDKVYPKSKEHMYSFLDKLSLDEQKELLSLSNVCLEEVSGSSIIYALKSVVQTSGFSSLPLVYVKAGAALLDIVQASPSRFPISSQELFNILDDASEKTLCAGNAVSLQKFVFDGEVGKVALDVKNVIACTSFLLEKELVKAWLADKDAEALRCQQLLMEEEEAAQKRQTQLLERKRKKKMRQKEHMFKENGAQNIAEFKVDASDSSDDALYCAESSSPRPSSDLEVDAHNASFSSPSELLTSTESSDSLEEVFDVCELESEDCDLSINQPDESDQRGEGAESHNPVMKSRNESNGSQAVHKELKMRWPYKELKNVSSMNSQMVWTRKIKPEWKRVLNSNEGEEVEQKSDQIDGSEVLIGSITVSLGNPNTECASEDCTTIGMPAKLDAVSNGGNRPSLKHWRPVSRQGEMCSSMPQSSIKEAETSDGLLNGNTSPRYERISLRRGSIPRLFSSQVAEDFLAQRWKAALGSDHVKIATSSFDDSDDHQDDYVQQQLQSFDCSGRSILGNAENRMSVYRTTNNVNKPKFKPKIDKTQKVMYVPKQSF